MEVQSLTLEKTKQDEKRGFLCIDWPDDEPYKIYGWEAQAEMKMLEFIMAPCNYRHKEISEEGLPVREDCITDPEEQFKYLGSSINLRLLYNEEVLDTQKFDDSKHVLQSQMMQAQFNPREPTFYQYTIV